MTVQFKLKPIIPKKFINADATAQAVANVLDELAEEAKELFEKTTASWENQPEFIINERSYGRNIETARNKDGEIFNYVDKGTRPHVIRARRKPRLMFQVGGFRPKTRPGVITSSTGARGGVWVGPVQVNHPGTEARGFGVIITERIQKKFAARMNKEIRQTVLAGEGIGL